MARAVTTVGDRIAALTSAGTLYLLSYQNEILTCSGCGSMDSILPTGTPTMRTTTPPRSITASATARKILAVRVIVRPPRVRGGTPRRERAPGPVTASVPESTADLAAPRQAVPAAARRAAVPAVARGRGSSPWGRAAASRADHTPD